MNKELDHPTQPVEEAYIKVKYCKVILEMVILLLAWEARCGCMVVLHCDLLSVDMHLSILAVRALVKI